MRILSANIFPLSGQMENEETLYRLICESNFDFKNHVEIYGYEY